MEQINQISQGEEYLWKKRIEAKIQQLVEDKISILRGNLHKYDNSETQRPFVNSIKIKLKSLELGKMRRNKKDDYLEQKFRITKQSTFDDLRTVACEFWGLDRYKYSLYDENFHDLMSLNQDPSHIAHTVEKYFEITRVKAVPILYLQKPNLENSLILP